jgi:hypothetical protein
MVDTLPSGHFFFAAHAIPRARPLSRWAKYAHGV